MPEEIQDLINLSRMIQKRGSRVTFLSADNRGLPSNVTLETAWHSSKPFFIEVDDSVVAVDYDDELRCRAQQFAFRQYVNDTLHRDPVTVYSGRGIHQFVRLSPEEMHHKPALIQVAKRNGGDVRRFIRPPLSPHRLDYLEARFYMQYENARSATDRLGGLDSLPLEQKLDFIPPALYERICGQFVHQDRSNEIVDVMSEMIREGVSDATIYEVFNSDLYPICEKLSERPQESRQKYIKTQVEAARRFARIRGQYINNYDPSIYSGLDDYIRTSMNWTGVSGCIQRDLLLSMIHVARILGTETFYCSLRDLGLLAEVATTGSVRKNLDKLMEAGHLQRLSTGSRRQAATYRITLKSPVCTEITHSSGGVNKNVLSRSTRFSAQSFSDLFRYTRRRGTRTLGKTAGLIWDWIRTGPDSETPRELAERMNRPVANLRRYIHILESVGLISVGADRRIRILGFSAEELREVKRNLGCLGLREVYERRVRQERRQWGAFLIGTGRAMMPKNQRLKIEGWVERWRNQASSLKIAA